MYERWRFERWETPISDLKSVAMVSLTDDGTLSIVVEDLRDPSRPRWRFRFIDAPFYQNIQEEYRMELWEKVFAGGRRYGNTRTVPDSPWLASLREHEELVHVYHPHLVHFQISTEDDVIDILSPDAPEITAIAPAGPGDPTPGKSRILYAEDDREEVDELFDQLRRERDDT